MVSAALTGAMKYIPLVFSLLLPLVLLMSHLGSSLVLSLLVCKSILCHSLEGCCDLHCLVGGGADGQC